MAGKTSVPDIEFGPSGLVLPAEDAILAGTVADWNAALGGNLNPGLSTPQGQLASSQAAIIARKNEQFAAFVNGVDPATSDGPMQDGIGKLYFLERLPAVATVVDVACSGRTGVTITVGALVQDTSGNVYACVQAGTIPAGGSVTLPFANLATGPVACPAGAINGAPYKTIPGWDRATNPTAGVTGRDVENRADFEYRRQLSVARNARGTIQAIYGEVINVADVSDAHCLDNYSNGNVVKDGITLRPHSTYVAAVGGTNAAIAAAIWSKAGGGADFTGNTSATVTDDSDYNLPKPTYSVSFQRPAELPIFFKLSVQNLSGLPNATIRERIQAAIVAAFKGSNPSVPRARIASTIIATQYIVPVVGVATMAVLSIFVGTVANAASNSVYVGIGNAPTIDPNNVTVDFI